MHGGPEQPPGREALHPQPGGLQGPLRANNRVQVSLVQCGDLIIRLLSQVLLLVPDILQFRPPLLLHVQAVRHQGGDSAVEKQNIEMIDVFLGR